MFKLLFLLATAQASDVYEICVHKRQTWSEERQGWRTTLTTTFYTVKQMQFIVHENSFEIDRARKNIQKKETIDNLKCFREHENSFVCYDPERKQFLWEFHYRNGKVTRDVLRICSKNGVVVQ